jgi:SAM-dependent methyltransferase
MKVFETGQTREQYFETQVERSRRKFGYCKVSARDALKYEEIVRRLGHPPGPVLCLGTRNGREVDLFRQAFRWPKISKLVSATETTSEGFHSRLDRLLGAVARSNAARLNDQSVIGVEINPMGGRQDVWIGSFDETPKNWENTFSVIYSNSFDQSQDPARTAAEWKRIAKPDGLLIFGFAPGVNPSEHDPVGDLALRDVLALFGGEMLFYHHRGSANCYSEVVLRIRK